MHIEFFEHESEICQTMPFLVLCLVLTILNSFYFHVKVRFFQHIDIQDDAIGNMLVKFPSLLTCSLYKKIWPVVCPFLISSPSAWAPSLHVYLFVISLVAPPFTRTPKTIFLQYVVERL